MEPKTLRDRLESVFDELEDIEIEFESKGYSIMDIEMSIRSLDIMLEDEDVEW